MDAINFVNYIKNPGYLNQVTFQELNNLIEQYPFCQNLHYLALRKAQIENHKDFVKKLGLAATYCPDRQWLYKQLQEVQSPDAISDVVEASAEEEIDLPDENTTAPLSHEDIPVPIEKEGQVFVDDAVEEITDDEIIEISETPDTEQVPVLSNPDIVESHSISDNDQDEEVLTDPIRDTDLNLQNPEDMTPPDDKDKKVIYMEDLFEDANSLKENKPPLEPSEEEKTILFESEDMIEEDDLEEPSNSSVTDLDFNPSKDHIKNIPFEVYQPGEEDLEEEEGIQFNKPDVAPETEHLDDDFEDQPERTIPMVPPSIEVPVDALNEDEEEIEFTEAEEAIPEKEAEESEGQKAESQSPEVAPMPKSAFNSWHQANAYVLKTTTKKAREKKREKVPVYKVADLFKEKSAKDEISKEKSTKKKKKKGTKGFAMESLLEHKDVISETLAKLLAGQGRKKKAITMYRRLIEMHPEKKDSYEKRIKKLKKKG